MSRTCRISGGGRKREPDKGLEPLTYHLQDDCSAIELIWQRQPKLSVKSSVAWDTTLLLYDYQADSSEGDQAMR